MKSTALAAAAAALLGTAGAARAAEYATVVSATPVTSAVSVPRQECADVERVVPAQSSGGGAIIGALIGGVLGNQFGHGAGRAVATAVGAIAGSAIGNQAELGNRSAQTVPARNCRTVGAYENRVIGYDVVYEYHDQRYTTRMASDPGPRLAIDVRPSRQASADPVGPPAAYANPAPAYGRPVPAYSPSYEQPVYDEPAYVQSPPAYYAPGTYYAPAPVYYNPGAYIAPVAIGLGIGYWAGNRWQHGNRHHRR
ncbi:MAG: glycine zipper 2TM domain-containing protein [Caldimonas sp.]